MANQIELWKEKYYKYIIVLYFILLLLIAFGLKGLFSDSKDMGYMSTSPIFPVLKEVLFSLLTFCFGLFYGISIIVGKFDWTRRIQSVLILAASIIVAVAYTYIIILRPIIFFSGLAAGAYLSHITRTKKEKYVEYKVSLMILAIVASIIVWLTLLNYIAGKLKADTSVLYFLLASAFSVVFYKFATYPINKCKLFIVGPKKSGKSVFTCALYAEAKEQNRLIGNLKDYLAELYGRLHSGLWLDPNLKEERSDLSFLHGHLFTKEVNLDIDYAGDDLENKMEAILDYLERKGNDSNIQPQIKIEYLADGMFDANKLIFIIDPARIGSFSWEKIPGNDSWRLINFLTSNYGVDWVKTAQIAKIDNGKTIMITGGKNFISLNLINQNTELNLKFDNDKTDKLIVRTENGNLNIYNENNYINKYYRRILNKIPGKSYCLVVTKSDILYDGKKPDKNYEDFKEYVIQELTKKEPFFDSIAQKAEAVLPVIFFEEDNKPVIKNGKFSTFGYDKVLEVVGR